MKPVPFPTKPACRAAQQSFTLIELLVVMAIMAILAFITVPAISGIGGASQFTQNVGTISLVLERARDYAVARNTYSWVAFYSVDPSTNTAASFAGNSGNMLFVAAFSSNDGTCPVSWSGGPYTLPYTNSATGTIVSLLGPFNYFKQIIVSTNLVSSATIATWPLSNSSVTNSTNAPTLLPTAPVFTYTYQQMSLSSSYLVEFTPTGSAMISTGLTPLLGLDFEPMLSKGITNSKNYAAIRISGLTGIATTYRN